MTDQRNPGEPELPPSDPAPEDRSPFERPPFDRDPEAQHAPGAGEEPTGEDPPPMQASAPGSRGDTVAMDAAGAATEPVGNHNILDGTVGGVMGPAHQTMGQGQGG